MRGLERCCEEEEDDDDEDEDGAIDDGWLCVWAVGDAIVVVRVRLVVSADGGGGREVAMEARQRKHSPVPK